MSRYIKLTQTLQQVRLKIRTNKQWEVITLEQLTSHGIEQAHNRPESPTITPPGMR